MKKFILSMFVIVSFGFYAVWQNVSNASNGFAVPVPVVAIDNTNTKGTTKQTTITSPPIVIKPSSIPNPTPITTPIPTPVILPPKKTGIYNDGTYTGNIADAYYGYVQVKAIITNGKLTDVVFLDYPQDRSTSVRINRRAMPILIQEAITAQSANVNGVSGASATSPAFVESLTFALNQARV